ncbi:MAG: hypothetical protein H6510_05280 [Acidobacteria bacterium]|nr:hypothetical protein [Acidobacteriota bacterium]MCB9397207.1 hypothetical protein [Acidobacteriota bacterium]
MSDSLLKSMLHNLSETERSQFVMEVFESLSPAEQQRVKARLIGAKIDLPLSASPTQTAKLKTPAAPISTPSKVTDFDVFTQSMSNQFEDDRRLNFRKILGCGGLILLALVMIIGLSMLLKYASDLLKVGVPH